MTRILLNNLTADDVHLVLDYDPGTGLLRWKFREEIGTPWNRKWAGKVAGSKIHFRQRSTISKTIQIKIGANIYRAHRLIWLMQTGKWPNQEIDHIDMDGFNNKWNNLREANYSENKFNRRKYVNNKTGFKGVFLLPTKKYWAKISVNKKQVSLGTYSTPEEAAYFYAYASQYYHGEFGRTA